MRAHARAYKRQKHARTDARTHARTHCEEKPSRGRIAVAKRHLPRPPTHNDTHTERRSRQAAPRERNPKATQKAQTSAAHRQSPPNVREAARVLRDAGRAPAVSGQRSGGPPNSLESPLSLCRSKHFPPKPHLGSAGAASSALHTPLPIYGFALTPRTVAHAKGHSGTSLKVTQSKRPLQLLPPNVTRPPLRISFCALTQVPSKFLQTDIS